jgi:hypothetical protein
VIDIMEAPKAQYGEVPAKKKRGSAAQKRKMISEINSHSRTSSTGDPLVPASKAAEKSLEQSCRSAATSHV